MPTVLVTVEREAGEVTDDPCALLAPAVGEARIGLSEGGIPIGAALVIDGEVVATGRNRRVQHGSAIHHGETNCLENAGRLGAADYGRSTMVTTLSPCDMCTGVILLYKIPRVIIGEHRTFLGNEELLRERDRRQRLRRSSDATSVSCRSRRGRRRPGRRRCTS